jgi:hypothetical protein
MNGLERALTRFGEFDGPAEDRDRVCRSVLQIDTTCLNGPDFHHIPLLLCVARKV